jgi:hypothetical protein
MYCKPFYYAGIGDCKALRWPIAAIVPMPLGTTITKANAGTLAGLKAAIVPAAGVKGCVLDFARGYEVTTDEPEMVTSNLSYTEKVQDNNPKFNFNANISYSDYKNWFPADGKAFEFMLINKMGDVILSQKSDGNLKPFRGRMFVMKNLPKTGGDLVAECKFDILFDSVEEFENIIDVRNDLTFHEIVDINPAGVNIEVVTAYEGTGGTVVVKATYTGTDFPVNDLDATANWAVLATKADTGGAVTVVGSANKALGVYTLTVLNGAAKMTGPFTIQATKDDATYVTKLSNALTVKV